MKILEISDEDEDVFKETNVSTGDKMEYEYMKRANQNLERQIESLKQERARNRQHIQYITNINYLLTQDILNLRYVIQIIQSTIQHVSDGRMNNETEQPRGREL